MHGPEKKREARQRYVNQRQNLPTIGDAIGVPAGTISQWKRRAKARGDDWQAAREAHLIAGEGLDSVVSSTVEDFVMLAQETIGQLKGDKELSAEKRADLLAKLADPMGKMVASAGRLAPKISELGVAQDVLRRLGTFIHQNHPDEAATFLEVLEPFGIHLTEIYEGKGR